MSDLAQMRRDMLVTSCFAREGHLPSSFSVLELLVAIYDVMGPDDKFTLSKGHAALALYTVLAAKGILPEFWWQRFCQPGSYYEGHPNHRVPGVTFSTGSLGHGIGMAAGLALGMKIQEQPGRVFCLVGDEELNEGSCWETALLAYTLRLNNFVVIVDDNGSSPLGMRSIVDKFNAFGWSSFAVDGHSVEDITKALDFTSPSLPTCVVACTTKGYGCKPLRDKAWHHRAPTAEELKPLLEAVT